MASLLLLMAVKDRAAGSFMRPFVAPSRGIALRSFRDEVNRRDAENQMFNHPSDFELYQVGSFDDESGVMSGSGPELVARAEDLKESGA